jgi:hypothetical protein
MIIVLSRCASPDALVPDAKVEPAANDNDAAAHLVALAPPGAPEAAGAADKEADDNDGNNTSNDNSNDNNNDNSDDDDDDESIVRLFGGLVLSLEGTPEDAVLLSASDVLDAYAPAIASATAAALAGGQGGSPSTRWAATVKAALVLTEAASAAGVISSLDLVSSGARALAAAPAKASRLALLPSAAVSALAGATVVAAGGAGLVSGAAVFAAVKAAQWWCYATPARA